MDSSVKRRFHPLVLVLAVSLILSCAVPDLAPAAIPTTAPGSIDTIVAQTAEEASVQTAAAASLTAAAVASSNPPTRTPTPTYISAVTVSPTPSNTPTFLFMLPSFTATFAALDADYACKITEQSPDKDAAMAFNQQFVAHWIVYNIGINTWDPTNIDLVYLTGDMLYKSKASDLPKFVVSGQPIDISLTMTSPKSSGSYKTIWGLRAGKEIFCRLTVSIVVK